MPTSTQLATFARLRGQLDVRATQQSRMGSVRRGWLTGLEAVDRELGGLPLSALTELVCSGPSGGAQLFLGAVLARAREARQRVALIDAGDAFDPCSHAEDLCRHLVWVRCAGVAPALQAADLVMRDANFGLVVLDLKHAARRELRRTPATLWYRLQRALEPSSLTGLVITSQPTVPSAQLRLELTSGFTLADLTREQAQLAAELAPIVQRQRVAGHLSEEAAG
jgi:hypothetical protein